MSTKEIVKAIYYLLLIPGVKMPDDSARANEQFWEFMHNYSTWPKHGLSYFNKETGKFDSRGYVEKLRK